MNKMTTAQGMFTLLLFLALILAAQPLSAASVLLSTDKQTYSLGETVHFTFSSAPDPATQLVVVLPSNESLVYLGTLTSFQFTPKEAGTHKVQLRKADGTLTEERTFLVAAQKQPAQAIIILTDKPQYQLKETVYLSFENLQPQQDVVLLSPSKQYRYLGIADRGLTFIPEETGNHTVVVEESGKRIAFFTFQVMDTPSKEKPLPGSLPGPLPGSLKTDKAHYVAGDTVQITFGAHSNRIVRIRSGQENYQYPALTSPISFVPRQLGVYFISLVEGETILAQESFSVGAKETPQHSAINTLLITSQENSPEQELSVAIKDHAQRDLPYQVRLFEQGRRTRTIETGKPYELEVEVSMDAVKRVSFKNLTPEHKRLQFHMEDVEERTVTIPRKNVFESYAIDTSGLNFSTATVTAVAKGRELYKCAEWNFTEQRCFGNWRKVRDITPGEEYSFEIYPGDPGYAETGLASINTNKSIYHPQETAGITIVVLDQQGHLVGSANLSLTITDPLGAETTYSTEQAAIVETQRGIYQLAIAVGSIEGNYSLDITVLGGAGSNVSSSMHSQFHVASAYAFDIIRQLPHTIDPWQHRLEASLLVQSLLPDAQETFTLEERLPLDFQVLFAPSAVQTTTTEAIILTWSGLTNDSRVNYTAQPPLVTPQLYALGPARITSGSLFEEARPWYLAIDPVENASGCRSMLDATTDLTATLNWDGTFTTDCVDSDGANNFQAELQSRGDGNDYSRQISTVEVFIETNHSLANFDCQAVTNFSVCVDFTGGQKVDECWVHVSNGSSSTLPNTPSQWEQLFFTGLDGCKNTRFTNCYYSRTVDTCAEVAFAHARMSFQRSDGGPLGQGNITYDYVVANYTVITLPPTVALRDPVNATLSGSAQINFTFIPSDQTGIGRCNLVINGSASQPNTSLLANNQLHGIATTLTDGDYLWSVNCSDAGNSNYTNSTALLLRVDTTAPSPFSLSSPANTTISNDSTPLLQWQATSDWHFLNYTIIRSNDLSFGDSSDTIYSTLATAENTSFQVITAWSANRPHHWMIIAYDQANNSRNSSGWFNYTLDSIAPAAFTLSTPANGIITTNRTPLLQWQASSDQNFANHTIQVASDSSFATILHTYYALGNQSNTSYRIALAEQLTDNTVLYWRILAYDLASQSTASTTFTYTTDTTEPLLSLFLPANKSHSQANLSLNYSAFDQNRDACTYRLNAGDNVTISSCRNTTILAAEGGNFLILRVNDSAGNINQTNITFSVDLTDPRVRLESPANGSYVLNTSLELTFTAEEINLHSCVLFGNFTGTWRANQTNDSLTHNQLGRFPPIQLEEKAYLWNVYCNDTSARSAFNSTNFSFTVDASAPLVNLSRPLNNTLQNTTNNILFFYNATDAIAPLSSCQLIFNDVVKATRTNPQKGTNNFSQFTQNGLYNWTVNCTDTNGFRTQAPVFNLTVDVPEETDPPLISLNSPLQNDFTKNTTLYFNYTVEDATGITNCSLHVDSTLNTTSLNVTNLESNNFTVEGFNEASYDWFVRCADNTTTKVVGTSETRTFTVDFTAPTLTLLQPENNSQANSSLFLAINYSVSDFNLHQCVYSLNGNANVSLAGCATTSFNTTIRGRNNITVHANDSAGNTNSTIHFFNVTANATLAVNFTPLSVEVLQESLLIANYSDEYVVPISDALCRAQGTLNTFATRIATLQTVVAIDAPKLYDQRLLKVDVPNLPTDATSYNLIVRAHGFGLADDSLRAYSSCDGDFSLRTDRRIGQISAQDALASPLFGVHILAFEGNITNGTCSILFESNMSSNEENSWIIGHVSATSGATLNPNSSSLSTDLGESFTLHTKNVSAVDMAYIIGELNLTFNVSNGLNQLSSLHSSTPGLVSAQLICSAEGAALRQANATLTITDTTSPIVQINELQNLTNFSIQNQTIRWTANDISLNTSFLRIFYPNGTRLGTFTQRVVQLNASQLPVSGLYTLNAFSNDTSGNSNNATANFTSYDTPPSFSNVSAAPSSPFIFSPSQLYQFNISWNDLNNNLAQVLIEHNFTGTLANYTVTAFDAHIATYNYTALWGGTYVWRSYANDSNGNINSTPQQTYVVQQAASIVNLTINGTATNAAISEGALVNATAYLLTPPSGMVSILQNGTFQQEGGSPLLNRTNYSTPGYYNITARYAENRNYTANQSSLFLNVRDTNPPTVSLMEPPNLSVDNDGAISFHYNVSDSGMVANCSLFVNETQRANNSNVQKDTMQSFPLSLGSGSYNWSVRCTDLANHNATSETRLLTVTIVVISFDFRPRTCYDNTGNCNAVLINTTDTDSESHGTLQSGDNFVYANLSNQSIRTASNITHLNISWDKSQDLGPGQGTFFIHWVNGTTPTLICSSNYGAAGRDELNCSFPQPFPSVNDLNGGLRLRANFQKSSQGGNPAYSTFLVRVYGTYVEDTTPAEITLLYPQAQADSGVGTVIFNYTASDASGLGNCSLWGDFNGSWQANQTNSSPISGQIDDFGPLFLDIGFYRWNVQCYDIAGNAAFASSNHTINITKPDLTLNSSDILFLNSTPLEGQNITINATIYNTGLTDAGGFIVQFFSGNPAEGNQLGANISFSSLAAQSQDLVTMSLLTEVGPNNIYVVIDGNNSVNETSEGNNQANNTVHVTGYSFYFGNFSRLTSIGTSEQETLKSWQPSNSSGKVYLADADSSLDFTSLQALGRTVAAAPSSDDFEEADALLGMTNFTDSLSRIYTSDGQTPLRTVSLTVFETALTDIPVTNSTISQNFETGILWDTSDDDSANNEYDAVDQEDLLFVFEATISKEGRYGFYSVEMRAPTLLRQYALPNNQNNLVFYTEIS